MRVLKILLLAALATGHCSATSIIFPTFSTPILKDGIVVALSPERTRLVAFSIAGERRWEKSLEKKASLKLRCDNQLLLLTGSTVSLLNVTDGSTSLLFNFPEVAQVKYDEEADLFIGAPPGKIAHALTVYSGGNGEKLFSEKEGENVIHGDNDLVIVESAVREAMENGYTFTQGWLSAYRRSDGTKIWSVEFKQRPGPFHSSAKVGSWLIVEDGSEWLIIDYKSGEVQRRPVDRTVNSMGPYGLKEKAGQLVFIMGRMDRQDFKRNPHTIYTVSVPDFKTVSQTEIEIIEAGEVENAGDFLITDSLYRTACFRRDGSKVWEHFQMHRKPAAGGFIYFSDYEKETARIGSIEVATGKENIFTEQPVSLTY